MDSNNFSKGGNLMISLTPLDVGFDLRTHGMPIDLSNRIGPVKYVDGDVIKEVDGTRVEIARTLAKAGYSIIFGYTPNGREIRCESPDGRFAAHKTLKGNSNGN
jgi:hypothetical protein